MGVECLELWVASFLRKATLFATFIACLYGEQSPFSSSSWLASWRLGMIYKIYCWAKEQGRDGQSTPARRSIRTALLLCRRTGWHMQHWTRLCMRSSCSKVVATYRKCIYSNCVGLEFENCSMAQVQPLDNRQKGTQQRKTLCIGGLGKDATLESIFPKKTEERAVSRKQNQLHLSCSSTIASAAAQTYMIKVP